MADAFRRERHIGKVADPEVALRAQRIDLRRRAPKPRIVLQGVRLPAPRRGGDDRRFGLAHPEAVIAHGQGGNIERGLALAKPPFVNRAALFDQDPVLRPGRSAKLNCRSCLRFERDDRRDRSRLQPLQPLDGVLRSLLRRDIETEGGEHRPARLRRRRDGLPERVGVVLGNPDKRGHPLQQSVQLAHADGPFVTMALHGGRIPPREIEARAGPEDSRRWMPIRRH